MVRRAPPRALPPEPAHRAPSRRRAGRPVADRHRGLLRGAQGRAAAAGARRQVGLGHRAAPRRLAEPGHHPDRPSRPAARGRQGQPDRHVERRRGRALHGDGAAARAPAGRPRLPVDRLLAVHGAGERGRRRPRRTLGRQRQDRVRPARRTAGRGRERRGRQARERPPARPAGRRVDGRRRRLRARLDRPAQVPRHLPTGRPRRAPRTGIEEAAPRLLLHGARRRAGRADHRRAVAGPRSTGRAQPTDRCA